MPALPTPCERSRSKLEARTQADASKAEMVQQAENLHIKQQDIVKFVNGVPETAAALQTKLEETSYWCSANHLDAMPVNIGLIQENLTELSSQTDRRLQELTTEISTARAAGSADFGGFGDGFGVVPHGQKYRNVFDPRDYKLSDLGVKPTTARWKKWCRDLEGFIDTIGLTWKGASGLLRELWHCEAPFEIGQVQKASSTPRSAETRRRRSWDLITRTRRTSSTGS